MDRYNTGFEDPVSGQVTSVGVTVTRAAMQKIETLVGEAEPMVKRCVWRYIGLKCEAGLVEGESVEFTIDSQEILKLFSDLRQIDLEAAKRAHRQQSNRD